MDYNMDFSFIIPIYNSQSRLKQCVESVIQLEELCSYEFEIILVDDGSTDYSVELVDAFAVANKRFFSIHQKNKGVSAARNIGLKASRGKYVVFIDSDDTIITTKMLECMKNAVETESINLVIFGISFDYFNNDRLYRSDYLLPPYCGIQSADTCMRNINTLFDSNCLSSLCNKIISRQQMGENLLKEDMFLYEDLEFFLRILPNYSCVYFYQDVVYQYYQANHSDSRIKRVNDIEDIVIRIEDAFENLDCDKRYIVERLRTILYREKINSLSIWEIRKQYPHEFYKQLFFRPYHKTRHTIAEWLKQHIGDFRKWQKYQ